MSDVNSSHVNSIHTLPLFAKDRFVFWPIVVFYVVGFGPAVSGEFWQQDDLSSVLILVTSLLIAVLLAVVYLFAWRWRNFLSVIAAPFIVGGIIASQLYFGFDPQWTKFQIMRPYYLWSVHGLDRASFEWPEHGVFLGGGWNETLIYDPTDEILADVKNYPALAKYAGDDVVVRNMGSHFYLVTSNYGM